MSHYLHLTIVRGTVAQEDLKDAVTDLMAKYDESIEVEPYKSYITNNGSWADLDRMRDNYGIGSDEPLELLLPFVNDWTGCAMGCTPGVDRFGLYTWRTYNPAGRWDYWRIGGRWDGDMLNHPTVDDHEGGFNFSSSYESIERNAARGSDVLALNPSRDRIWRPYSIVTPDGNWCQKPQYYLDPGYSTLSREEQEAREQEAEDAWTKQALTIMETLADDWFVSLDYHR